MIGKIRLVLALSGIAAATVALVPVQLVAMKTRLYSPFFALKLWHGSIVRALGFRIHLRGRMSEKRPLLLASNHVSWTDINVLGSRFNVSFIAKSELEGWPVMGWLSKLQRTVFVERERKKKSGDQASEIGRRLAEGDAMVLFAEGSTGDGNFLMPFKTTLFGAAQIPLSEGVAERVFVQPVTIAYTRIQGLAMGRRHRRIASWIGDADLLPHLKTLFSEGGIDVEVHFGEPVEFAAGGNRKEVARIVEGEVRGMLAAALRNPRKSS